MKPTDTETQILEAAKKVFVQKGFSGARMQEIADEAKINKAMLHYYFRSKELLFEKILSNSIETFVPQFLAIIAEDGSVMDKIEKVVHTYIEIILENPHIPLFVLHELSQNRADFVAKIKTKGNVQAGAQQFLRQIVQEQQQGIIKPIAPHHLLLNMFSLTIFPFIARPVFSNLMQLSEETYSQMMQERKTVVIKFLRDALLE